MPRIRLANFGVRVQTQNKIFVFHNAWNKYNDFKKNFIGKKFLLSERECEVAYDCESYDLLFKSEEATTESLIDAAHQMAHEVQSQCPEEDFTIFYLTLEGKYEEEFQRL